MAKKNTTATKKKIGKAEILNFYMNYVLENNSKPNSMYQFAHILGMKETEVYQHFASFKSMEQTVFESFFEHSITLLEKDSEYHHYDAKNKLLSFYFTFFEILKENRSYVILALSGRKQLMDSIQTLGKLRNHFKDYIDGLDLNTMDFKNADLEKIKQKGLSEIAWSQLMATMKYWIDDTSAGFEKTDLFIEKSLKASFELIDTRPLESVIDFTKFLFKEKFAK